MSDEVCLKKPRHIAFIMDGNGRWAKERGFNRNKGHQEGAKTVNMCVEQCIKHNIPWLTLFAFSSENWNRPEDEVKSLMKLLHQFLSEKTDEMIKNKIKLHVIGDLSRLPSKTQKLLLETIKKTTSHERLNVVLALSYGSRQEIIKAAKEIAFSVKKNKISPEDIDETLFSGHLYTAGMPDPDLLIRTSGEYRISNFLLWQISYSELYITDKFWPEFSENDFEEAIANYSIRQRRFGGI